MVEIELGNKRMCSDCKVKFYDLGRNPLICPKCGAQVQIKPPGLGRSYVAKPGNMAAAANKAAKANEHDDEEEENDDDDDDPIMVKLKETEIAEDVETELNDGLSDVNAHIKPFNDDDNE